MTNTLKIVKNQNNKSGYVFCKEDGKPFKSIRTGFEKAVKKAGLAGFRFHVLRYTFASRLAMRVVELLTMKQTCLKETQKAIKIPTYPLWKRGDGGIFRGKN